MNRTTDVETGAIETDGSASTAPRPSETRRPPHAKAATVEIEGWGRFVLAWNDDGLMLIGLPDRAPGEHLGRLTARGVTVESTDRVPENFQRALESYASGDPAPLAALPIAEPGTEFQHAVWDALRKIPPGETRTYGQVAAQIGHEDAARAVGSACGSNLVAIAVPCHRVLAHGGSLGGYAAGLVWKRRLLEHELRIRSRSG